MMKMKGGSACWLHPLALRRSWAVVAALVVVHGVFLTAHVVQGQRLSAGCSRTGSTGRPSITTSLQRGIIENVTIVVDDFERDFLLYLPSNNDNNNKDDGVPLPLVLNFHGTPSTAQDQFYYTEMDFTAQDNNFIVVYPDGVDEAFNAGGCCADTHDLDDEAFARAIVEWVGEEVCVDLDRVFATGWSNGAYMSYYLACRASDVFSAIAPVGGLIGIDPYDDDDCDPSNPPRVLAFHEVRDPDVDYCGAYPEYAGAEELVAIFAEKQGCSPDVGVSYSNGEVVCRSHRNCPPGKNATLCTITRSIDSHSWPGAFSDYPPEDGTKDIMANEAIWSFFAQATLQDDGNLQCDNSPSAVCGVRSDHGTACGEDGGDDQDMIDRPMGNATDTGKPDMGINATWLLDEVEDILDDVVASEKAGGKHERVLQGNVLDLINKVV